MIRKSSNLDAERSAVTSATPFVNPASKKLLSSRGILLPAPIFDSPFASVIGFPISQMLEPGETGESPIALSNSTNSKSPHDMKSRIFIGNLNTNILTKRQLHLIFSSYGEIRAISMHKGFAFIQYTDEMDALNAVYAQDGRILAGQAIDVNLVTAPKSHQKSQKKVALNVPAGDACTSLSLHSSTSLMRTGSSSSSASSCSAFSCTKSCLSCDPRSPDVRSERGADPSAGSPEEPQQPEIDCQLPSLLPSSNLLATPEPVPQSSFLFESPIECGISCQQSSFVSIESEIPISTRTQMLLLETENQNHEIESDQSCGRKTDRNSASIVRVTAASRVLREGSDTRKCRQVAFAGSQKEESASNETAKSQNEEMIEEVGSDGEDLKEEQSRNAASNRLLAFPVSLDNSSTARKTEFCSLNTPSSSDALFNPKFISCKRPRLEIPHGNRHTLPSNTSVTAVQSPPESQFENSMLIGSSVDLMICGNCKSLFTSLPQFCEHKQKKDCRLRFVCHCRTHISKDDTHPHHY